MSETLQPNWNDIEIDKIPGAWVLTWWLPDESVTLRLKVRHLSCTDPDDFVAEVKIKAEDEFKSIHELTLSVYEIAHPKEFDDIWVDLPGLWTNEFKAMLQVWARLTYIAEFGASGSERYAGEPHSTLDHFYLDGREQM